MAAARELLGELLQWDTSEHDWMEGRANQVYLIAMIDDASSRALARFVEQDSTEENMRLLLTYLERYGRPVEFTRTDKDSMFTVNRPVRRQEDEVEEEEWTQIGRALRELEIGWIPAPSPQANTFCERLIGTIRRECLDFLIPLNEKHLRRIIREWATHYNKGRPHSSLGRAYRTLPMS